MRLLTWPVCSVWVLLAGCCLAQKAAGATDLAAWGAARCRDGRGHSTVITSLLLPTGVAVACSVGAASSLIECKHQIDYSNTGRPKTTTAMIITHIGRLAIGAARQGKVGQVLTN